jgi:lysozyme
MKRTSLIRASIQAISVTILLTTVTGILFYFGLIMVNEPDRQQFPVRGIDISNHQGAIDWPQIDPKAIQFILIKATEGGDFKDKRFASNWQNAQQRGITVGAYHFFTFCRPGQIQAQNYINTVPKAANSLPPVIDLEFSGNCAARPTAPELFKELDEFIAIVEKFYGKKAIFYVTHEFFDRYLQNQYLSHPIWLSDFYSFGRLPSLSDGRSWSFWQYSERGRIAGISGLVDLNVFRGNSSQLN